MPASHYQRETPPLLQDLLFGIDEPLSSLCERLEPKPLAQLELIVNAVPALKEMLGPLPADAGEPDEAVRAKEARITVTHKLWMLRNSVSVCSNHLRAVARANADDEVATADYTKQLAAVDAFGTLIDIWTKDYGTEAADPQS